MAARTEPFLYRGPRDILYPVQKKRRKYQQQQQRRVTSALHCARYATAHQPRSVSPELQLKSKFHNDEQSIWGTVGCRLVGWTNAWIDERIPELVCRAGPDVCRPPRVDYLADGDLGIWFIGLFYYPCSEPRCRDHLRKQNDRRAHAST